MTTQEMNRGFKISLAVWGALIGTALVWLTTRIVPSKRVLYVLLALLAYETATIVDKYKGNTLSEAMWFLSKRPLIPLLFGVAIGWSIGLAYVDPFSFAIGMLYGHFFWQAQREETGNAADE